MDCLLFPCTCRKYSRLRTVQNLMLHRTIPREFFPIDLFPPFHLLQLYKPGWRNLPPVVLFAGSRVYCKPLMSTLPLLQLRLVFSSCYSFLLVVLLLLDLEYHLGPDPDHDLDQDLIPELDPDPDPSQGPDRDQDLDLDQNLDPDLDQNLKDARSRAICIVAALMTFFSMI